MRDRALGDRRDYSRAAECDALLICADAARQAPAKPDLRFVTRDHGSLAPHLRAGQLCPWNLHRPGTTAEVLAPISPARGP